ncbi:hypothetical protein [Streptomyces lasiicapitis]|uniref:hypothetical protein n=1 Tax=Streptomyces lasiicapitis TaxID=1923961 RepID=UPI0036B412AF
MTQIARTLPVRSSRTADFMELLAEEAGPVPALRCAADAWASTGDDARALPLYRQAAEAGDEQALERSADTDIRVHGTENSVRWLLRLGKGGHPTAYRLAARLADWEVT